MRRVTTVFLTLTVILMMAGPAAAGVLPGEKAPDFTLTDTDGQEHHLQAYLDEGNIVVLEWFNPDCPFIRKHHENHKSMNETYAPVQGKGVIWLAINSGAKGKQGAGLERNAQAVKEFEMVFPVLLDENGAVGKQYGAKTTPHMFVITADGVVAYNGAIDDDRSAAKLGETNHVAVALGELLAGGKVQTPETQPYGCSVKYAK